MFFRFAGAKLYVLKCMWMSNVNVWFIFLTPVLKPIISTVHSKTCMHRLHLSKRRINHIRTRDGHKDQGRSTSLLPQGASQGLGQCSHQLWKSGNSGKNLNFFSSQGNQGKTGRFQAQSGKKLDLFVKFLMKLYIVETMCPTKNFHTVNLRRV